MSAGGRGSLMTSGSNYALINELLDDVKIVNAHVSSRYSEQMSYGKSYFLSSHETRVFIVATINSGEQIDENDEHVYLTGIEFDYKSNGLTTCR